MPSLQQVKNRIRAVLLSAKHGCSPRQLLNDYEHFIGESIPYEELGFNSFMDLLRAIPDAVCIVRSRDRTTVYGVPDTSTQHIAKMVSKQRDHPSYGGFDGHGHPRMSMIVSNNKPTSKPVSKTPQVPSTFRVQLRSLLLSYPNGVLLSDFSEAFARRFAYYCNYKSWGFKSLEEVLKSVPDIITLERDPMRDALVIKRVVANATKKHTFTDPLTTGGRREVSPSVNIPSKPHPLPVDSLHSIELSPPKKTSSDDVKQQKRSNSTISSQNKTRRVVSKKLIEQIDQLLKINPGGLWMSTFSTEFKEYYKEDLPVISLGFISVTHLLSSLSDICKLEKPSSTGDWLVCSAAHQELPKVAPNHAVKPEAYISNELMESIHSLLKSHPNGIPLTGFSNTFSNTVKQVLPVEEIGFQSLTELLQKVPGVMVMKPPDKTQLMVYRTTPLPVKETIGTSFGSNTTPSVGVKLSSSYAKQPLPQKSRMCPVYVTHVKTPSCLIVQLLGEKTTKALEFLLEDITQFYNSKDGDGYRVEKINIGEPCCATFNNDGYWYRCEVENIPASDIVEVKYVDYGNTAVLPLGSIRRPKPHYLTLPAQAIECRLANLKPPGSTWRRMSTRILFEMTKDKPIVAIVTAIKNGVMSVCLCDTNTEKDIHINDTLVNQGLALFSPDSQEDQEKGFDEYNLEPVAVGSTGDNVPEVRMPEDKGQVASAPTLATPTMPTLQIPTVSQMNQLQLQNYLQQLLLLQQQQNAFLMNPVTNPMLTQNHLLAPTSGQGGFQPSSAGLQPFLLNPVYPLTAQTAPTNPVELVQPVSHDILNNISSSSELSDSSSSNKSGSVPPPAATKATPISPPTFDSITASTHVQSMKNNGTNERGSCSSGQSSRTTSLEPTSRKSSVEPRTSRGTSCETEQMKEDKSNHDDQCLVKRVTLTSIHSLSILQHNGRAYFMSCEVSEWFWESDLLKSMLRQVQKQVWGLLLIERKAPQLFEALRECEDTIRFVEYEHQLTLYALEDLPLIVSTFHAPSDLCLAVNREVNRWQATGINYFNNDNTENEIKELESRLKKLQGMRKEVLVEMMEKSSDESAIGKAPLEQLIELEREIANVRNTLSELDMSDTNVKKESATERAPSINEGERTNTSENSSLSSFNDVDIWLGESTMLSDSLKITDKEEAHCKSTSHQIETPPPVSECLSNETTDVAQRNEVTISPPQNNTSNEPEDDIIQLSCDNDNEPMLRCGKGMLTIDQVVRATSGVAMATNETQTQDNWKSGMMSSNEGASPMCSQINSISSTMSLPVFTSVTPSTTVGPSIIVPHTEHQQYSTYGASMAFVPSNSISNRRAPSSSVAIGLGRGLSKGGVAHKPRSIGLGRGISHGRKPGMQVAPARGSEAGEWQVVGHHRRNYFIETIPPMGSGAGLDII